jgi:hypothetical protein
MPTCWKCGQKTPEGVVECEGPCGRPPGEDKGTGQRELCLTMQLFMDHVKVASNPAGHYAATLRFSELLGAAIMDSGLSEYIKEK